jgi:hypothetical protein
MSSSPQSEINISWDAASQYILLVVKGYLPSEKIQAKLHEVLALIKQQKANKMLIDITQGSPYSKSLENWIEQVWEPEAIATGLKTQAFVLPKNAFTKSILDSSMKKTQNTALQRGFFDSVEGAEEWLKAQ